MKEHLRVREKTPDNFIFFMKKIYSIMGLRKMTNDKIPMPNEIQNLNDKKRHRSKYDRTRENSFYLFDIVLNLGWVD